MLLKQVGKIKENNVVNLSKLKLSLNSIRYFLHCYIINKTLSLLNEIYMNKIKIF